MVARSPTRERVLWQGDLWWRRSDIGFQELLTAARVGIRAPSPRPLDGGTITRWERACQRGADDGAITSLRSRSFTRPLLR